MFPLVVLKPFRLTTSTCLRISSCAPLQLIGVFRPFRNHRNASSSVQWSFLVNALRWMLPCLIVWEQPRLTREESLWIIREIAARRQAELAQQEVEEEVADEEECEEEEVYVPASRFPPDWLLMRMCRLFQRGDCGRGLGCTSSHCWSELHPQALSVRDILTLVFEGERTTKDDNSLLAKFHFEGMLSVMRGVPESEDTFDVRRTRGFASLALHGYQRRRDTFQQLTVKDFIWLFFDSLHCLWASTWPQHRCRTHSAYISCSDPAPMITIKACF